MKKMLKLGTCSQRAYSLIGWIKSIHEHNEDIMYSYVWDIKGRRQFIEKEVPKIGFILCHFSADKYEM